MTSILRPRLRCPYREKPPYRSSTAHTGRSPHTAAPLPIPPPANTAAPLPIPRLRLICILISLLFAPASLKALERDSIVERSIVHHLSVFAGMDYVASSVEDDIREKIPAGEKVSVHSAVPVNLKYSFSFTDNKVRHYLPGGYQGLAVGILNYGALEPQGFSKARRNIGYPVLAFLFQGGPFYKIGKGLRLNYEWNFGASFGWKPWNSCNENFNLTVGSKVNAYLNLNILMGWQVSQNVELTGGVAVSHFSNGNTSFPNPGVNSFGLRLGMTYTFNPASQGYEPVLPDTVKKKKVEYDILAWGSTRKRVYRGGEDPVLLPGHFACAGLGFAPMVRLNTWWRVGGSLDLQWDRSSDMKRNYIEGTTTEDIKFTTPSFWRQVSVGVSAHGELQMPIFSVNVGIGYNVIAPWENRGSYQNISLKTYIGLVFFVNVGYQLRNFHQQSSLMLGAGLTL